MGLHFPKERQVDLERGLTGAAKELGFSDIAKCAQWLLSASLTKPQFQTLASHLTVGETYFFREPKTFDVLRERIFPQLLRAKAAGERRLRIWSAACCTGEEPYSLAILLDQIIPVTADWQVTILASDINTRFLQKAAAGIFGEWSFRDAPPWLKERYFRRTADGRYAILPEIKKRVTFAQLNLAEDVFPSLATDTNAMDMIFCRNVLMYFTPPQARKAAKQLRHALTEDGWLVVSGSEGSQVLFTEFAPVNFPGVILYQKSGRPGTAAPAWTPAPRIEPPPEPVITEQWLAPPVAKAPEEPPQPPASAHATASLLYQQGHYAEAADALLSSFTESTAPDASSFSLLARALANQGQLATALVWCDRWVAADKLDPSGHYFRAVVLQELGQADAARQSLQRALYLQPDFVLAHFAMANLARSRNQMTEANKHLTIMLGLLQACQPNDLPLESDGLTAGRLTEIITSLLAMESAA
jgi:chemotaxis protein methyltransferase CheR